MALHPSTDDGMLDPDTQVWADTHARLQGWCEAFLPLWTLALPVWADWMMIQVAHGYGQPAISFPDPYAHASPPLPSNDHGPRFPVPRGWASQWEEANRLGEPGYQLTAHGHVARLALLPKASQACLDACATAFPLLERRSVEPVLMRLQIRRRASHFSWEMTLARWDTGRARWIDAGKSRPDLVFFQDRIQGTVAFQA